MSSRSGAIESPASIARSSAAQARPLPSEKPEPARSGFVGRARKAPLDPPIHGSVPHSLPREEVERPPTKSTSSPHGGGLAARPAVGGGLGSVWRALIEDLCQPTSVERPQREARPHPSTAACRAVPEAASHRRPLPQNPVLPVLPAPFPDSVSRLRFRRASSIQRCRSHPIKPAENPRPPSPPARQVPPARHPHAPAPLHRVPRPETRPARSSSVDVPNTGPGHSAPSR